jgi:hypothetical protein
MRAHTHIHILAHTHTHAHAHAHAHIGRQRDEAVRSGLAVMKCSGYVTSPDPFFSLLYSRPLFASLLFSPWPSSFSSLLDPLLSFLFATLLSSTLCFSTLSSLLYSFYSPPLLASPLFSSLDVCHSYAHSQLLLTIRIQNTHTFSTYHNLSARWQKIHLSIQPINPTYCVLSRVVVCSCTILHRILR